MSETAEQVMEAEVVEESSTESESQAVVPASNGAGVALAVTPQVNPKELIDRLEAIKKTQADAMVRDVDYGIIPGTDKPTLFKPGAEKLNVLFQLDVQLRNEKRWEADNHLTVVSHATVFHAPTGARLGYGEGVCSTREKKYAYRMAERSCPNCGVAAVIKGKEEYGGGWLCWKKKDGCGSTWPDGTQAIEGQEVGQIDNPDLPDLWNTVVKMAEKRARVDAVLAVTGASAIFTQDVEDQPDAPPAGNGEQSSPPRQSNGQGNGAPQTKAQPRQSSTKPISGAQKGKINALLAEAALSGEQASALRRWWTSKAKCSHFDRMPSKAASELIDALGEDGAGAWQILSEIAEAASGGNNVAQHLAAELAEAEGGEF